MMHVSQTIPAAVMLEMPVWVIVIVSAEKKKGSHTEIRSCHDQSLSPTIGL